MEYGMMLEVYVIVILIVKILLFYYFDLIYEDEGVYVIRWNEVFFIFVLFDGSLGKINLDGMVFYFYLLGVILNVFYFLNIRYLYIMRY